LSLLELLCCGGESGKKLHQYLDYHLVQGRRRRDLGINVETLEEVFDRFEQLEKPIMAVAPALGSLVHTNVTIIHMRELEKGRYIEYDTEASIYQFRIRL
jgi:hypothetical protein